MRAVCLPNAYYNTPVYGCRRLPAFGWTLEHVNMLVKPMVKDGKEVECTPL